jgi:hypothetical protein
MNHMNETFDTSDLPLATTLSLFEEILEIDRSNPNQVKFKFPKSQENSTLVKQFWSGELKVSPISFYNRLNNIKSQLRDGRP